MTLEMYKNTFVTLEESEGYFDERFDSLVWFAQEESEKEKLLITASKKISRFDFVGNVVEEGQPMAFPRDFALPQDIKDAVCEEAVSLIKNVSSVHKKNQEENISSISLGAGSVSYNSVGGSLEDRMLCSPEAIYLVKKWVKKGCFYGNL